MDTWRLIIDGPLPGSVNMARDMAIMKGVGAGQPPTLRLYRWFPPAVTVGYFQIREDETDPAACRRDNVPVIRRITGGGAVFHDKELTYSIAVPLKDTRITGSVADSYRVILQPVIDAVGTFGITAEFRPINDLTVCGKKISGSAQTRREGVLLQHGTLLLSIDRGKLSRYLKISPVKKHTIETAETDAGITAMDEWIGENTAEDSFIERLNNAMVEAFARRFDLRLLHGDPSGEEETMAAELERTIFLRESWNDKRKIQLDANR